MSERDVVSEPAGAVWMVESMFWLSAGKLGAEYMSGICRAHALLSIVLCGMLCWVVVMWHWS